jgi:hypothetical protein
VENSTKIGGSHVISTKTTPPQKDTPPQIPQCHIGHNSTKSNKPSRVPRTQEVQTPGKSAQTNSTHTLSSLNLYRELEPMYLMKMARTQVLKSSTSKFQQLYKSLWGNKGGRTREKSTKDSNIQI